MAAETRERIFEPFFTGYDVSRHSSGTFEHGRQGLGLGLALVKAFIEMHGGTVTVESQPGEGTTFTLTLPPEPPVLPAPPSQAASVKPAERAGAISVAGSSGSSESSASAPATGVG
jgi:hypothetical protein